MDNVQKAKEKVMEGEGYLHIKRLPRNTTRELISFLNDSDEFNGDWGMGMKYIWDTFKGMLPPKDGGMHETVLALCERVDSLEKKISKYEEAEDKKFTRKLADGSKR